MIRRVATKLKPSIVLIDQITIKTSKPKCHLNLCLIEFIDWRYSQSLFSTSCKLTPLYLLSSSPPPPPIHEWIGTGLHIHSIQCVTGGGKGWVMWRAYTGVIHCVFDQIPNLQNCFTTHSKQNLGGGVGLRPAAQSLYWSIFKKSQHLGIGVLIDIWSMIVLHGFLCRQGSDPESRSDAMKNRHLNSICTVRLLLCLLHCYTVVWRLWLVLCVKLIKVTEQLWKGGRGGRGYESRISSMLKQGT